MKKFIIIIALLLSTRSLLIQMEYIETEYEYILMNWGWEDANDNYLYSPNIGHDWIIQTDEGPVHYQYGVEVFYDFN